MNKIRLGTGGKVVSRIVIAVLIFFATFSSVSADMIANNPSEVIFSQETFPIASIDPNMATNISGSFFPGLRGANQLIIYTPAYGKRTNTNEFGAEAIVNGSIVTSISGADSVIPSDGLVISAHGAAKKWLSEKVFVGSKIYIDKSNKLLTVYLTSESFIYGAKEKIKEACEIMEYYRLNTLTYDYKTPNNFVKKAQEQLVKAQKDPKNVQKYATAAIEYANKALETSVPYDRNESKGVWIRPTETTPEDIDKTLRRLHKAGIDSIFLETYFHGRTIFPSNTMARYGFIGQNEKFAGFDPLKVWIEEAHKHDIKVNIWFETFYIGNQNPADNPKNIIRVKPNWANTTKKSYQSELPTPSMSEHNGYFIDPANPDVQKYLLELLTEIINTYKPDGINLDYIRYPQSISSKFPGYDLTNWGYTNYAREEFEYLYAIDPITIQPNTDNWLLWNKYRQDKITNFVKSVSKLTKSKGTSLTTVIFPDRNKAIETKQQDWKVWSELGLVDGYTPLLLTCDATTARVMMQDVINNKNKKTDLYAGLFVTFMGGAQEDLIRQIHEARKLKTKGVIIFDYAHFDDKYVETLTASAFKAVDCKDSKAIGDNILPKKKRKFFRW